MQALRAGDPRSVGPFRLTSRLGAGAMGEVFLGADRDGKLAAVKLLNTELAASPEYRRRFKREVVSAKAVRSVHTARVIDADHDAERPWLATEYFPGPTLREAVAERLFNADQVAALGIELAKGLAAIHRCKLIHRDLKPSNVIMAEDGPRIIDFGIARAIDSTLTGTGTVLGTFGFMSPEQVQADTAEPASDVFSLGCVLVFAATGNGPFDASSPGAVVNRVLNGHPRLDGVADDLRGVIEDCLAKHPDDRPGTNEVADRLGGTRIDPQAGRFPEEEQGPAMYPQGRVKPPLHREDAVPTVRQEVRPTPPSQVARRLFLFGSLAAIGAATIPLWGSFDAGPRTSDDDGSSGGGDPNAPSEPEFDPEATYAIEYAGTGMVLDVTDVSYENGAIIQQWYDFGADNQRWRFESVELEYLRIVSVSSGKSLGVVGTSFDDGALIQQWDFNGGYEQQWKVTPLADGTYSIINRLSDKALDVPYGSPDNGVQIQQWAYHGGANQRWTVTPD